MENKIFENTSFLEVFSHRFVFLLKLEDLLKVGRPKSDFYLSLTYEKGGKEEKERAQLFQTRENLSFLLISEEISSSSARKLLKLEVFVDEIVHRDAKVVYFDTYLEVICAALKKELFALAPWEDLLLEELQKKLLAPKRSYSLFKILKILNKKNASYELAKRINQNSSYVDPVALLDVRSFFEMVEFQSQVKTFKEGDVFQRFKAQLLKKEKSKDNKLSVFLSRKKNVAADKISQKKPAGDWLILSPLGVKEREKTQERLKLEKWGDFLLASKPFMSAENFKRISLWKCLELDFYLSCDLLSNWEIEKILWDESEDDVYLKALWSLLLAAFLCE